MRTRQSKARDFIEYALAQETDECILWPYGVDKDGYGRYSAKPFHDTRANRVVCELAHGPQPPDRPHAAHTCGNTGCINWRHIYWATVQENVGRDRQLMGRVPHGENHPANTVLTDKLAIEVWERAAAGERIKDISADTGVSLRCIRSITHSENWVHLNLPRLELKGKQAPRKRLSVDEVRSIRKQEKEGVPRVELAKAFGVSRGAIDHIVNRRTWTDVE